MSDVELFGLKGPMDHHTVEIMESFDHVLFKSQALSWGYVSGKKT